MEAFGPPLATSDLWVHINMSIAYHTMTFTKNKKKKIRENK